jgi:hypothetical protein
MQGDDVRLGKDLELPREEICGQIHLMFRAAADPVIEEDHHSAIRLSETVRDPSGGLHAVQERPASYDRHHARSSAVPSSTSSESIEVRSLTSISTSGPLGSSW